MRKRFVFIKLENKYKMRKIKISPAKKAQGVFAIKNIEPFMKRPYFVVSGFKIKKTEVKGERKELKGDIYGK